MNKIKILRVFFLFSASGVIPTDVPDPERHKTFVMVKPDGVQRGLVGEIIRRFEQKGYKLRALKFIHVSFIPGEFIYGGN
jgi:hypothetical protein